MELGKTLIYRCLKCHLCHRRHILNVSVALRTPLVKPIPYGANFGKVNFDMLTIGKSYTNRRGDTVKLTLCADSMRLYDPSDEYRQYDRDNGTCYVWSARLERWVMDNDYKSDIAPIEIRQAQDSLSEQMARVMALANENGEYDAADWIKRTFFE